MALWCCRGERRSIGGMEVGEEWAYRPNNDRKSFDQVVVRAIGTKRPPRVRIEFGGDEYEGKTAWVSPARLECPWPEIEAYAEADRRWKELSAAYKVPDFEHQAAEIVFFTALPDDAPLELLNRPRGITEITDMEYVTTELGISKTVLLADPVTIVTDTRTCVPWPTTVQIIQAALARNTLDMFGYLERVEREAERESVTGYDFDLSEMPNPVHVPGDRMARYFEANTAPIHAIIRGWMGEEVSAERADLVALRAELARVGDIAQRAISQLKQLRSNRAAEGLLHELLSPRSQWHGHGVDAEKDFPYKTPYQWVLREDDTW